MKKFSILMFIIIFPVILMCVTWTVRQDGNGDYETIQEAIDDDQNVSNGHTLTVYYFFGDTPYGPIDLGNKELTINAFSNFDPVIVASSLYPAVDLGSADSSTLNGFTITGTSSQTGILISSIDQINITNCIIEDLSIGISISNSQYIDIENCTIEGNAYGCYIDDISPYPNYSRVSIYRSNLNDNTRAIYLDGLYLMIKPQQCLQNRSPTARSIIGLLQPFRMVGMGRNQTAVQNLQQVDILELMRNQRKELETPGSATQQVGLSAFQFSGTRSAQDELKAPVLDKPVYLIHEVGYLLHFVQDDRTRE